MVLQLAAGRSEVYIGGSHAQREPELGGDVPLVVDIHSRTLHLAYIEIGGIDGTGRGIVLAVVEILAPFAYHKMI